MTDGNNNTTRYAYDARKRLTVTTYPDQTTKTNAYDGPGNLASVTDQAQNVLQYTYDAANQLASVIQAGEQGDMIPIHSNSSCSAAGISVVDLRPGARRAIFRPSPRAHSSGFTLASRIFKICWLS
jgi:YD repeat-containing protein